MFREDIGLNKEKIEEAGKYNYDKIMAELDKLFRVAGMKKIADGSYLTAGDKGDMSSLLVVHMRLREADWFLPYVDTWLLHEFEKDGENIRGTDDVKEFYYKKYGRIA